MPRSKLPTTQVGVRFADDVLDRVDEFTRDTAAEMMQKWPGYTTTRADAVRLLVERALRDRGYLPDEKTTKAISEGLADNLSTKQITEIAGCRSEDVAFVQRRIDITGDDPAPPTAPARKKRSKKK